MGDRDWKSRIGGLGDQGTAYRGVGLLGIGESGDQRLRDRDIWNWSFRDRV